MTPLDRNVQPTPGPLRPFDFPGVSEAKLSNGVPLEVVSLPRLPVVTALLSLRAGEEGLTADRGGLSILTGDALEGGTRRRSGAALAEALEALGADVDVHTGWSGTTVSLSCLADRLPDGLALLGEMVREPSFPEDEVARARQQQMARIRQGTKDPGTLASQRMAAEIYAEGEGYARPAIGREEVVEQFQVDTLRGYAEGFYQATGAALVVSGDVDADEVLQSAEGVFGDWAGRSVETHSPKGQPNPGGPRVVIVDMPAAVQSEIRIAHVGVARDYPEFAALQVGNAILGGTFSSRLNLNLREKNGFTYGVRSRFAARRGPGPFSISTAVDTENTPAAIREAFHEVRRLLQDGPEVEEIEATRDYLAGIFPLRLESTGQVAARVAEVRTFGLPRDEWTGYRDRIRAVTPDAALAALRETIRPDEMVVVIAGNAEGLVPGLEALQIGPIQVIGSD